MRLPNWLRQAPPTVQLLDAAAAHVPAVTLPKGIGQAYFTQKALAMKNRRPGPTGTPERLHWGIHKAANVSHSQRWLKGVYV